MRLPLSMTLPLLAGAAASVGACGPNVILDGMTTGSGSGGNGSTTGMAFGGSTTGFGVGGASVTNTVGVGGVSSTSGFGGGGVAVTNAVSVGTGGFTVASSAAVGTGGGSVTTVTSTGTGVTGACTDGLDEKIFYGSLLYPILVKCAFGNLGNAEAEAMCIEPATGLSAACTECIVDDLLCSLNACTNVCAGDPNGGPCETCRDQNCAGAFLACSGVTYAPGSTTCQERLFNGTKGTGWQRKMPASAFITVTGQTSYKYLDECACLPGSPSCIDVCDDAHSNGPPDFCNGAVASPQCLSCLESSCGADFMNCQSN